MKLAAIALVAAAVIGVAVCVGMLAMARPLFFASIDEAVAVARGVPVRVLGIAFLVLVGVKVLAVVAVRFSTCSRSPLNTSWLGLHPRRPALLRMSCSNRSDAAAAPSPSCASNTRRRRFPDRPGQSRKRSSMFETVSQPC